MEHKILEFTSDGRVVMNTHRRSLATRAATFTLASVFAFSVLPTAAFAEEVEPEPQPVPQDEQNLVPQDEQNLVPASDDLDGTEGEPDGDDPQDPSGDGTDEDAGEEGDQLPDWTAEESRPAQSDTVATAPGTPNDSNWDVVVGEDGVYKLTFTIGADAEGDQTIELSQILDVLQKYAEETGNIDWNGHEPGDGYKYQVFIKTDSNHTYKYKDGSFILSTPNLGDIAEGTGAASSEEVGFDGQVLPENVAGKHNFINATTFELSPYSVPVRALIDKLNLDPDGYLDINGAQLSISYPDAMKLRAHIESQLNESFSSLDEALKAYLVSYYETLDVRDYADFESMLKESPAARDELYSGTQATKGRISVRSVNVTNKTLVDTLTGTTSTSTNTRFAALVNLINDELGTEYSPTYNSSKNNWNTLKNALKDAGYTDAANLIPTGSGNSAYVSKYLQIYNLLNPSEDAFAAYCKLKGYNPADFQMQSGYVTGSYSASAAKVASKYVTMPAKGTMRYDNFYQNLLTFVFGDKDTVDAATGGMIPVIDREVIGFEDADGAALELGWVYGFPVVIDEYGIEHNLYTETGSWIYWTDFAADDAIFIKDADGNLQPLTAVCKEKVRYEFENDSWSYENVADAVAEYMKMQGSSAWTEVDQFFTNLFSVGLTSNEAARANQLLDFFAAFNLDGELTGNGYQNTSWSFYNSIQLEQMDGAFHLEKVDKFGDKIVGSEASFQLWHFVDDNGDGIWNDGENKFYYTTITGADGTKTCGFVEYNPANKKLSYTIDTVNGELNIDYALLKDVMYYLQEVVAPEGYLLDSTIKLICTEDSIPEGFDKSNWLGEIGLRDENGAIQTLNVELINYEDSSVRPGDGDDPNNPNDPNDPNNPNNPNDPNDLNDPCNPNSSYYNGGGNGYYGANGGVYGEDAIAKTADSARGVTAGMTLTAFAAAAMAFFARRFSRRA